MQDALNDLRAEVAALRAELTEARADRSSNMTRRRLLTGLAGLGAAGAASVATAQPAAADNGDPLLLGQDTNTATATTRLIGDVTGSALSVFNNGAGIAADFAGGIACGGIIAVNGEGYVGVQGRTTRTTGIAVEAIAEDDAFGLVVTSENAAGVQIHSVTGPHIVFDPVDGVGPTNGHLPVDVGALTVDANLDLWLCTAAGDPPTWTRLLREDTTPGRVIPIAPMRALDTRATGGRPSGSPAVPGQKKGPLRGGETLTLDLAGVAAIPATASGVVGNVTAVTPNYTGYLRAAPSGGPLTATALSFAPGPNTGNAITVGLGPDGVTLRGSGTAANTYHLVIDVTAYIT